MLPKLLLAQLALLFGITLCALPARAERGFPGVISNELGLGYEPPCSVCHLTNKTGAATVTTPFAYSLRERGLSSDQKSLALALTRLTDDKTDSDGDGVSDVVELKNATDPNSKTNASLISVADPSFGCSLARPSERSSGALLLWIGLAGLAWGRSRRSKRA